MEQSAITDVFVKIIRYYGIKKREKKREWLSQTNTVPDRHGLVWIRPGLCRREVCGLGRSLSTVPRASAVAQHFHPLCVYKLWQAFGNKINAFLTRAVPPGGRLAVAEGGRESAKALHGEGSEE